MDWSDEEVRAFVADQINHYGFEVSPEETKQGTSVWKQWLWLERHGYDFAYASIAAQIFRFRVEERPCGVLPRDDRRLLLKIRILMRSILGMEPLTEAEADVFLSTSPLSNWTHWASLDRPHGPQDIEFGPNVDFTDLFAFAWNFLADDKPDYIRIMREIWRYDDQDPEYFEDDVTINGSYQLCLSGALKREMLAQVSGYHLRMSADLFYLPGNIRLRDAISGRFLDQLQNKLAGEDDVGAG